MTTDNATVIPTCLAAILTDEEAHVRFFEREITCLVAETAKTLDRYLEAPALDAVRPAVAAQIHTTIEQRLFRAGLLSLSSTSGAGD